MVFDHVKVRQPQPQWQAQGKCIKKTEKNAATAALCEWTFTGIFYFDLVKPLMPILALLSMFCVCKKLECFQLCVSVNLFVHRQGHPRMTVTMIHWSSP